MKYKVRISAVNNDLRISFGFIPKGTTILDLSDLSLGSRSFEQLIAAFPLIPATVIEIDFRFNEFDKLSDEKFAEALTYIAAHIKSVSLNYSDYRKLVAVTLKGFMTTLESLELTGSGEEFDNFNDDKARALTKAFINVPNSLKMLKVINFGFAKIKINNITLIANCFSILPKHVHAISFRGNKLSLLPLAVLKILFNAIAWITCLDLSLNNFGSIFLAPLFDILPRRITTLIFTENDLYRQETMLFCVLSSVFLNLSPSINFLDLADNTLSSLTPTGLAMMLSSIPGTVISLDVQGNQLHDFASTTLAPVIKTTTTKLNKINLSENRFHDKPTNDFAMILSSLSSRTSTVVFSWADFRTRTISDLSVLGAAMPHVVDLEIVEVNNDSNFDSRMIILNQACGAVVKANYASIFTVFSGFNFEFPKELILEVLGYMFDIALMATHIKTIPSPTSMQRDRDAFFKQQPLVEDKPSNALVSLQ